MTISAGQHLHSPHHGLIHQPALVPAGYSPQHQPQRQAGHRDESGGYFR